MITHERIENYKKQALAAVAARAKNPLAPGISCVSMTPHDVLALIAAYDELSVVTALEVQTDEC